MHFCIRTYCKLTHTRTHTHLSYVHMFVCLFTIVCLFTLVCLFCSSFQDTERLASYGVQSQRRVDELESGVERLRNQQDQLRRKLRQQADKKTRLEARQGHGCC